jgi:serine/threonine-protein kinase RsbW
MAGTKRRTPTVKETFELIIPSDPRNIQRIEDFLYKATKHTHLDEVQFHKLLVAVTEAVNNAIIHGNRSNDAKSVQVICTITRHYIFMSIKDEGNGFNPDNIPNPLKDENLFKESGRGIFLMKTLMDEVEFHQREDGLEVLMSLYIGPKKGIQKEE